MTPEEFTRRFPEWDQIRLDAPEIIETAISDAEQFVDAAVWGSRYAAGLAYKAADLLAGGPFGENARLKDAPERTNAGELLHDRPQLEKRFARYFCGHLSFGTSR